MWVLISPLSPHPWMQLSGLGDLTSMSTVMSSSNLSVPHGHPPPINWLLFIFIQKAFSSIEKTGKVEALLDLYYFLASSSKYISFLIFFKSSILFSCLWYFLPVPNKTFLALLLHICGTFSYSSFIIYPFKKILCLIKKILYCYMFFPVTKKCIVKIKTIKILI